MPSFIEDYQLGVAGIPPNPHKKLVWEPAWMDGDEIFGPLRGLLTRGRWEHIGSDLSQEQLWILPLVSGFKWKPTWKDDHQRPMGPLWGIMGRTGHLVKLVSDCSREAYRRMAKEVLTNDWLQIAAEAAQMGQEDLAGSSGVPSDPFQY